MNLDNDKLGSGYKNPRKISGANNDPSTKHKFSASPGKSKNPKKVIKKKKEEK